MKRYGILDKIERPADLRAMGYPMLYELCEELRTFLLDHISETGGHLASNLGIVELAVALERTFDSASDRLIYDVETYRTVDMKDLRCRPFCGRTVKEYLIHPGKASAEQRLRALLARISDPYGELDQLMVWSWELCGSRPNTYKKLKVEEGLFV